MEAIADAGLSPKDIDGVIPQATGSAVAEDFITNFGIADLRLSASTPSAEPVAWRQSRMPSAPSSPASLTTC
ncbi:MAG: hypothetical protein K2Y27_13330 [Xanthobacteraceae bacterium]|nr:hypothetical protein [Xanthobacteraceae bacterium]